MTIYTVWFHSHWIEQRFWRSQYQCMSGPLYHSIWQFNSVIWWSIPPSYRPLFHYYCCNSTYEGCVIGDWQHVRDNGRENGDCQHDRHTWKCISPNIKLDFSLQIVTAETTLTKLSLFLFPHAPQGFDRTPTALIFSLKFANDISKTSHTRESQKQYVTKLTNISCCPILLTLWSISAQILVVSIKCHY